MAKKMEFCLLVHQAKTGNSPTEKEVKQLREMIVKFEPESITSEINLSKELAGIKNEVISFASDKMLSDLYSFGGYQNLSEQKFQIAVVSLAQNISKKFEYDQSNEMNLKQKANQIER